MATLAEVAVILSGGTPSKANAEFWRGHIPWVSPRNDRRKLIPLSISTFSRSSGWHTSPSVLAQRRLRNNMWRQQLVEPKPEDVL
jgi:type I restriction enzyme S subunit